MAYFRGDIYIWGDGENLHLWNADGYDGWDQGWHLSDDEKTPRPGYENASGVSVPNDVMDEYVVMRLAEMLENGSYEAAIERALHGPRAGNFGGNALARSAESLIAALKAIESAT